MRKVFAIVLCLLPLFAHAEAPKDKPKKEVAPSSLFDGKSSKEPTYIKSDTLTVNSKERTFVYSGNVEVRQGDMTLIAATMEGKYNNDNQIDTVVARTNVIITKGEGVKATGERADYDRLSDTVLLSENPELQQNGSVLTADRVRIFLKDNRSAAEGQVRVKILKAASGTNPADLQQVMKKK